MTGLEWFFAVLGGVSMIGAFWLRAIEDRIEAEALCAVRVRRSRNTQRVYVRLPR